MTAIGTSRALGSDLEWLRSVLWSHADLRVTFDEEPPAGFRRVLTYGAVPSARRPRLLVPLLAPAARRTAFWQFNDGMTQRARISKAGAGLAARFAARVLVRDRIHVHVSAMRSREELAGLLPESGLAAILGRREVPVAITFGSPRPNRKPVLQAIERGGEPIAYMKVAWNELTTDLVRNEAAVLRRWAEAPPQRFRVPSLVHDGLWLEHEIVVTQAFRHHLWRSGPLDRLPPVEVLQEVSCPGGVATRPLSSLGSWTDIQDQLAAPYDRPGEEAVALAGRFEAEHGDTEIVAGAWHGDWAPWNMSRTRTGLIVWDWERARSGVPVGLDLAHFAYQLGVHRSGLGPVDAARGACRADLPLAHLGVVAGSWRAIVCLYLFELYRRYADGAREGVAEADAGTRRQILAAIERTAAEA